jgi:hypothetical protein
MGGRREEGRGYKGWAKGLGEEMDMFSVTFLWSSCLFGIEKERRRKIEIRSGLGIKYGETVWGRSGKVW